MKKKIFLMLLMVLSLGFLLSIASKISFGLEVYATNIVMEGNSEWILQIDGAVSHPINLTFNELTAMPTSTVYAELYCYGRLVTSGSWTGVRLGSVLEKAEFDQQAQSVEFVAEDGYGIEISMTDALGRGLLAYEIDGQRLPETLRLVLPGANGDRWIGLITHITVSTNATSPSPPVTSIFMEPPTLSQQSPTPKPSPPPQPTSSPSPDPSPSSAMPTTPATPKMPTTPTTTQANPKPFPITWTVTAVTTVTAVSAGFIVLFKKRSKQQTP